MTKKKNNSKNKRFFQKYKLTPKKLQSLVSGDNSAEKIETYLKDMAKDAVAEMTKGIEAQKAFVYRSKEQLEAMEKIKQSFIKKKQDSVKKMTSKASQQRSSDGLKHQKPSNKVSASKINHVENKVVKKTAKGVVAKKSRTVKKKQVLALKEKVLEQKKQSQRKKTTSIQSTKEGLYKKFVNLFPKKEVKAKQSNSVKTKDVNSDDLKSREQTIVDLHDSDSKGIVQ